MKKNEMIKSLIKNGFEKDEFLGFDKKVVKYNYEYFSISFDRNEMRDLINKYNEGSRICLMNKFEFDDDCRILVVDEMSCGFWMFSNLEDAYRLIEDELDLDFGFED
jgi:hypothetical protein